MAVALPLAGAFLAGGGTIAGVGAALAGASGFAAFAGVAGGIMSAVGMVTGSKTLTKVGGILGLAGAVTGLASSLGSGAAEAASSAGSAGEAASGAAGESVSSATDALKNELASNSLGEGLGKVAGDAAQAAPSSGGAALTLDAPSTNLMDQYRAGLVDGSDYGTLARNATPTVFEQTPAGGMITNGSDYGLTARGLNSASVFTDTRQATALGKIAEAGSQIKDANTLNSLLDKLKGAGQWVKENKELVNAGSNLLLAGGQAYQQGQQFDAQMNLLAQRRARLNNPVVLGNRPQLTNITPGG